MDAFGAVKAAAGMVGMPVTHVGRAMGKPDNYVANGAARGSSPRCDTMAAMLAPCGYVLAAVPARDVPPSAIVIDAPGAAGA